MRVLVVGAGLAGTLLAVRLRAAGAEVRLIGRDGPDATSASGGLVRAFETDPTAARLAARSLAELYADADLRRAAGYHETGSVYLTPGRTLSTVDPPAGAEVLDAAAIRQRFGFGALPADTVGVVERRAGYLSPHRLRTALLSRFGGSQPATVTAVEPPGTVRLDDGTRVSADVVVLATGAWTAAVLRASGIPAALRTKHIQVCRYRAYHPGLPAFVDETSGLYGRPDEPGVVLLGLPSDRWDVDPAGPVADPALEARVRATAAERLPGVGLRPTGRVVSAADCYSEPAGLALRPAGRGLWTFSGGSGAAAKIALAASRFAAAELTTTMTYTGG